MPNIFFPDDNPNYHERVYDARTAKEICNGCPVLNQCFMYSVAAQEPYGIWAGLTAEERREMKRKRKTPISY